MVTDSLPHGEEKFSAVQQMFDRIAPKYDLMNRLITLGMDQPWRRKGLEVIGVGPGDRLLDVACGTGDIAEMAQARGAEVIGLDFAVEMLRGARQRGIPAGFVQGDAGRMPLPDASVQAVTCGFALRNFVNLGEVLLEMGRVLTPDGRLMILEVYEPKNPIIKAMHAFHFHKIVPFLGALFSDPQAYAYLPRSVAYLPSDPEFFAMFDKAGFINVQRKVLLFGAAQMITGIKR
jgi:demethylmenaquinone methyltransferase/2-methoxy-6-polyprenyl-1,4-benzoquinol methylase